MRRPAAKALVWPAIILAAVSIGLAAGPLPWRLAGESGLPPPAPVPGQAAAPDPVSLASILRLSPFGRLVRPSAVAVPAEETTLGLTLHGVAIAANPGTSSAIVSIEAAPARVYLIGDVITDSATLEAVFSDHVVLRVDGNPETLSFPKLGSGPVGGGVDALRALITTPDDAAEPAEPEGDTQTVIESYRQRIHDDPQAVLEELGLVATDDGYRVDTGAPDSVLNSGLLPDDVVAKVNGQQVGNIEQDGQLFDEVAASGRARIELLRQGQRIVLSFPLN